MMWVVRAGQNSVYYDKFISSKRIYLPWDGYKTDLSSIKDLSTFRILVEKEKGIKNLTSVSNWAGQLCSFSQRMSIGDFVLIPSKGSSTYCVSKIIGEYEYHEEDADNLYHSREIKVLIKQLPKQIFSQEILYSLGAYRTIFKANHENEIIRAIKIWKDSQV